MKITEANKYLKNKAKLKEIILTQVIESSAMEGVYITREQLLDTTRKSRVYSVECVGE